MHPHAAIIESFYTAFSKRDYHGMIACYAPNIHFSDPAFTLDGKQVGAMWHMLCESGRDMQVTFGDIRADDLQGSAHWEATYTFSRTKRKVHNIIDASFRFEQGKIVWHQDRFNFWRWSGMALGPVGLLFGWAAPLQKSVQQTASNNLAAFIAKHPEYQ